MNKEIKEELQPEYVYVPVSVKDELPKYGIFYFVIGRISTNIEEDVFQVAKYDHLDKVWSCQTQFLTVTHWLKKTPLSTLLAHEDKWMKALLSLTPGGSEFIDDPDYCVKVVKDYQEGLVNYIAIQKRKFEEDKRIKEATEKTNL